MPEALLRLAVLQFYLQIIAQCARPRGLILTTIIKEKGINIMHVFTS